MKSTILAGVLALCGAAQAIAQSINVSSSGVDIGAASTGEVGAVVQQSGQDVLFLSKDGVNDPVLNVIIKGDGNVGVGVAEPEEKLEVDGNITATGSISVGAVVVGGDAFLLEGGFESSAQAFPGEGVTLTVAHGLSGVPKFTSVVMRCVSPEYGWEVGDEIPLGSIHMRSNNNGFTIGVNNLVFKIRQHGPVHIHRLDAYNTANVDPAKWRLIARAWR